MIILKIFVFWVRHLPPLKYQLAIASNGENALKAVAANPPDLILLDVMMPGMDGFEVCQRLKAEPKTQNIAVIFVTAAVATDEEIKGLGLGAIDYIHKPYSIPVVQAKVALNLERIRSKQALEERNAALAEVVKLREDIDNLTKQDLKGPLKDLQFYARVMLNDPNTEPKLRLNVEAMFKTVTDILRTSNNWLDVYKMETGRYPYHPEKVDIIPVINGIVQHLQTKIQAKNIGIAIRVSGKQLSNEPFFVFAEADLCDLLLTHVIGDAVEACCAADVLRIGLNYENDRSVIRVINPERVSESLWARFFDKQSPTQKPDQETGIFDDVIAHASAENEKALGRRTGAYLARLMTETQNGTIDLDVNEQGTCITVRLPY